jgi:hypothetical protein
MSRLTRPARLIRKRISGLLRRNVTGREWPGVREAVYHHSRGWMEKGKFFAERTPNRELKAELLRLFEKYERITGRKVITAMDPRFASVLRVSGLFGHLSRTMGESPDVLRGGTPLTHLYTAILQEDVRTAEEDPRLLRRSDAGLSAEDVHLARRLTGRAISRFGSRQSHPVATNSKTAAEQVALRPLRGSREAQSRLRKEILQWLVRDVCRDLPYDQRLVDHLMVAALATAEHLALLARPTNPWNAP